MYLKFLFAFFTQQSCRLHFGFGYEDISGIPKGLIFSLVQVKHHLYPFSRLSMRTSMHWHACASKVRVQQGMTGTQRLADFDSCTHQHIRIVILRLKHTIWELCECLLVCVCTCSNIWVQRQQPRTTVTRWQGSSIHIPMDALSLVS